MRNKLLLKLICSAAIALPALSAGAQTTEGTDLALNYFQAPTSSGSASAKQKITLAVTNQGTTPISHFKAGVIKDGVLQFEEDVDQDIPVDTYWPAPLVTLKNTVTINYGDTAKLTAYVKAAGDDNADNDTTTVTVAMPVLRSFPYLWNDSTAKDEYKYESMWGMGWSWNDNTQAFYMSGKATNWLGTLSTDPINFTPGQPVMCSFEYGASGTPVDLTAYIDDGFKTDTITTHLTESPNDFKKSYFSFTPSGPSKVSFGAKVDGEWNTDGAFFLRKINFTKAVPDMSVSNIKSPFTDKMAASDSTISITATITNNSPFDIVNPEIGYQFGDGGKVLETYNGTIAANTSVDYTFNKGVVQKSTADAIGLTVWCYAPEDENADNDTLRKSIRFYEAADIPYSTDFNLAEDTEDWSTVDANRDGSTYSFNQLADGTGIALFGNYGVKLNDYLISPAIHIPAGTHRVSFYYSGYTGSGLSHLRLLAGRTTDVSAMTDVLFDEDVKNTGWINAYHLLSNLPEGNYYFAFELTGANDASLITHFKVDDDEDLCIDKVGFDTKSGYGLGKSKVTISYVNHGLTPQKDIKVRYYVNPASLNNNVFTENEFTQTAEETVTGTVAPGDTISYTFDKEADLSADTTYYLFGKIVTEVGDDYQNDVINGTTVSNWKVQNVPYYYGFGDADRNSRWTLEGNSQNGWSIDNSYYFDYDGNQAALSHIRSYADTPADDWAYSEAVSLKKGKYEVAFYYRGRTYFSGDEYTQKFEAKLGKERTPEAMTTEVFRTDSDDVYQPPYKRVVKTVDITEDGNYYLGFHDFSTGSNAETRIDAISITPVAEGRELPFASDFANDSASYTFYNNNSYNFTHWAIDGTSAVVNRDEENSNNYFEGMLVTPKLKVRPGEKIKVVVDYELTSEQDTVKMNVYTASVNAPQEFKLLGQAGIDKNTAEFEFTNTTDTTLFVGVRTNTDQNDLDNYYYGPFYELRVNSVKVSGDTSDGISTATASGKATVVARYNLQGQRVGESHRGVTILKMSDGTTVKTLVK